MSSQKPFRFKFFLPDARLLNNTEIQEMIQKGQEPGESFSEAGLWIELPCPDGSCLDGEGRITIPVKETENKQQGLFLNLFCPNGRCEVVQSTDLP